MRKQRRPPAVILTGVLAALVTLGLDRWGKEALIARLNGQAPLHITSFFNLVMVWNRGVSFGLFQQNEAAGRSLFIGFSLAVTLVLAVWIWQAKSRILTLGLGLIIGGALGNAYDRLIYGAVADFFDFHLMGIHFWAFNIADTGISVGVIILLLDSLFNDHRQRK